MLGLTLCLRRSAGVFSGGRGYLSAPKSEARSGSLAAQVWPLDGPRETPPSDGTRARYPRPIAEYFLTAELAAYPEVSRRLAAPGNETLDDLHHLLRSSFGWDDDHLYAFWLNGEFWSGSETEYTSPVEAEPETKTAEVTLDDLDLRTGQEIAYLFDFGDEWRVLLRVEEIRPKRGTKGRVLRSLGEAPPQYAPLSENE